MSCYNDLANCGVPKSDIKGEPITSGLLRQLWAGVGRPPCLAASGACLPAAQPGGAPGSMKG